MKQQGLWIPRMQHDTSGLRAYLQQCPDIPERGSFSMFAKKAETLPKSMS